MGQGEQPMKNQLISILVLPLFLWVGFASAEEITVKDSKGRTVTLQAPARRIVSLAPHATEMLFAAHAGEHIIGTVNYSNYPPAAKKSQWSEAIINWI